MTLLEPFTIALIGILCLELFQIPSISSSTLSIQLMTHRTPLDYKSNILSNHVHRKSSISCNTTTTLRYRLYSHHLRNFPLTPSRRPPRFRHLDQDFEQRLQDLLPRSSPLTTSSSSDDQPRLFTSTLTSKYLHHHFSSSSPVVNTSSNMAPSSPTAINLST